MVPLIFLVYLVLLMGIGYAAFRRVRDLPDYYLGGRKLGAVSSALSASTTGMNGWLLLGLPGLAMATGYGSFWLAGGLLIGTWLNWLVVAKRLRVYSHAAGNALTLPGYFENRFADGTRSLQMVCGFFILLFFLFYTAAGLVAVGKLVESAFGLNYGFSVLVCALVIGIYTAFGGYLAVSWTDALQGIVMIVALTVLPWIAIETLGGLDVALAQVSSRNPDLLNIMTDADGNSLTIMGILSLAGWGLGYFGQPHILARFKGIKSKEAVSVARRLAIIWSGFTLAGACMVGIAAIGLLPEGPADSERIFLLMAEKLFSPVVAGAFVIAILAAIMSTVDSQLLVASASLTEDFYKSFSSKPLSPSRQIRVGRKAVLAVILIAMLLAMDSQSSVMDLVAFAWAGFGAAFGPALVASLYWKRMNWFGALAGISTGAITVIVWTQMSGGLFDLYEIVPGMLLSGLAIVGVSLITSPPDRVLKETFDRVTEEVKY